MGARILVLGGGIGGVVTATKLRKSLASEHSIRLIERKPDHVFLPSIPWMLTGERTAADLMRPLTRLRARGVEVIEADVTAIDPESRTVHANGARWDADFIVVALGAELDHRGIPGWKPAALNFHCTRGATMVRDAILRFWRRDVAVVVAGLPYRYPFAPYEIALMAGAALRARGLPSDSFKVRVYTPESRPLPQAERTAGEAVRDLLAEHGVELHTGMQLEEVDGDGRVLRFAGGSEARFDLLLGIPPHRSPEPVREGPLGGDGGWIAVDRHSFTTDFERVYAIGDVTAVPLPGGGELPKAGVFAHQEGEAVADAIAGRVTGKTVNGRFGGAGPMIMETGDGCAVMARGEYYATPNARVRLHSPARHWHWAKLLMERRWFFQWFR